MVVKDLLDKAVLNSQTFIRVKATGKDGVSYFNCCPPKDKVIWKLGKSFYEKEIDYFSIDYDFGIDGELYLYLDMVVKMEEI